MVSSSHVTGTSELLLVVVEIKPTRIVKQLCASGHNVTFDTVHLPVAASYTCSLYLFALSSIFLQRSHLEHRPREWKRKLVRDFDLRQHRT
jgi:hypothetical protein